MFVRPVISWAQKLDNFASCYLRQIECLRDLESDFKKVLEKLFEEKDCTQGRYIAARVQHASAFCLPLSLYG